MTVLPVVITARSPLVFSDRRPDGQFRPSASYVPGAVLRGALAQQLIYAGRKEAEDFRRLFVGQDAPLFRNAYPGQLFPATAVSCKSDGLKHDAWDTLLDRLCCEAMEVPIPYLPRCPHPDHREKGERLEAQTGFYTVGEGGALRSATPPVRLLTRVALNRRRRVAESGMLYSPLVIGEWQKVERHGTSPAAERDEPDYEETRFYGSVVARDADADLVRRHLEALTHVGSGASRGFGQVEMRVGEAGAGGGEELPDMGQRVAAFNRAVGARRDLWRQLEAGRDLPAGAYFALLLVSDGVLREDGWTPTVRLEPELLGAAGRGAELVRCYATPEFRGGWNTAWGLPKDTELVARAGSVYLYRTALPLDEGGWLAALRRLETTGVGERRQEGFGQVRVCDPFHVEQVRRVRGYDDPRENQ